MKSMAQQIIWILTVLFIPLAAIAAQADTPTGHPALADNTDNRLYGKVVSTMDANNYTYVQIDTGEQTHWAAGPKTPLKKGAMIAIETTMPFTDFQSKVLDRTFKTIYFVNRFITDQPGQTVATTNPHANIEKPTEAEAIKGIEKAEEGRTVDEVFKQKQSLAGKAVRVRGQVVKYTPKVMGKNWLHIQDSSGTRQLVVTTDQEVKKGDLVLIKGVVAVDQDLGYGYRYDVIVEQARVAVE